MKILFLVSRVPYELDKGDKLRAYHHLKILSQKHEIILFALTDEPVPEEAEVALKKICQQVYIQPIKKSRSGFSMIGAIPQGLPFQVAYFYDRDAQKKVNEVVKTHQPDHIFCQ